MSAAALPELAALRALTPDGRRLFGIRMVRLFAFGAVSVVLALYLAQRGLTDGQIGLVLSLTLLGDVVLSLLLTTSADRLGRRRMLLVGAGLLAGGGLAFAATGKLVVLILAAI